MTSIYTKFLLSGLMIVGSNGCETVSPAQHALKQQASQHLAPVLEKLGDLPGLSIDEKISEAGPRADATENAIFLTEKSRIHSEFLKSNNVSVNTNENEITVCNKRTKTEIILSYRQ